MDKKEKDRLRGVGERFRTRDRHADAISQEAVLEAWDLGVKETKRKKKKRKATKSKKDTPKQSAAPISQPSVRSGHAVANALLHPGGLKLPR